MLDRTVSLSPTETSSQDSHGNDVVTEGTALEGVPAARDLEASLSGEDTDGADRQNLPTSARIFCRFRTAEFTVFGPRRAPPPPVPNGGRRKTSSASTKTG